MTPRPTAEAVGAHTLEAVLRMAAGGWRLFPVQGRGPKRPLTTGGFKDATTDPGMLEGWYLEHADRPGGVLWGTPDGFVVDLDMHEGGADGRQAYAEALKEHEGDDGEPFVCATRSGGEHRVYAPVAGVGRRIGVLPGVDLLGSDGFTVVWEERPPLKDLPTPPDWLLNLRQASPNGDGPTPTDPEKTGEVIPYGQRHASFLRYAGKLRRLGLSADAIEAAMLENMLPLCVPVRPDTREHIRAVARSAESWEPADWGEIGVETAGESSSLFYDPTERRHASGDAPAIAGIFYLGARTVVFGEAESMKTWLVLVAAAEEIREGRHVLWIDTDDMGDGALVDRLTALGLSEEDVSARLHYANPPDAFSKAHVAEAVAIVTEHGARLAVLDSCNAAMLLEGKDPNASTDVEWLWRHYASPLCDAGACFVLIDHVTKSAETRGGSPYGSERKRTGATSMLELRTLEPFGKGRTGRAKIVVQKDRPGHLVPRGHTLSMLELTSEAETGRVGASFLAPGDTTEDGRFRPTHFMERVSVFLEGRNEPLPKKAIESAVKGKAEYVRIALDRLVEEGNVEVVEGHRGALLHSSVAPFREGFDTTPSRSSRPRPETGRPTSSPRPPLTGDEDETRDDHRDEVVVSHVSDEDEKRADW